MISRRAALIELGLFLALVFSFIWVWARAFPQAATVVYLLGLGLTLTTHWIHRETPRELGVRIDNIGAAAKEAGLLALPIAGAFLILGWVNGNLSMAVLGGERFLRVTGWGLLQQYLLQSFIHRRLTVLIGASPARELAVGAIFAALHLPNPVLVPVTFLAGYVFAVLYRRHPNLLVLALCHAVGSTAVAFGFDPEDLRKMRVGPGYRMV